MEKESIMYFKQLFNKMQTEALNTGEEQWAREWRDEAMLSNPNAGDEVDLAQEARDRQLQLKLQGRGRFYMKKVNEAIERLENGTFGECEECGGEIGHERLKARPTATMCIICKDEQERQEEHVPYQRRSHTHGKTISVISDNVVGLIDSGSDTIEKINGAKVLQFTRSDRDE